MRGCKVREFRVRGSTGAATGCSLGVQGVDAVGQPRLCAPARAWCGASGLTPARGLRPELGVLAWAGRIQGSRLRVHGQELRVQV